MLHFIVLVILQSMSTIGDTKSVPETFPGDPSKDIWSEIDLKPPDGFPLELTLTTFVNWALDTLSCYVWTAYPKNGEEVVAAANWAMMNKYDLHPSGHMHNWSPFTIQKSQHQPSLLTCGIENGTVPLNPFGRPLPRVILLKTSYLNKMKVSCTKHGDSFVWTEPGVLLQDIMQELEENNLGFLAVPAPGSVTIGGVIAVGGHGTGVPAAGEVLSKGHTYGSLSNLIMSVTAVVYSKRLGRYTQKEFQRSDPEAKAFLVTLGRTFITNITLRAGPLQYLRCRSYINIPAARLFSATEGLNSVSSLLTRYGRIEVILFPFTTHPWLKIWNVEPTKPRHSREVTGPYNYPFSDSLPESAALIIKTMVEKQLYNYSRILGKARFAFSVAGLLATSSMDIWGPSKNTLLYVKPSTERFSENGYAILTRRSIVQRVVHEVYTYISNSILNYEARGLFPINGPLEVRVSGLDNPEDVLIEGAQNAGLSSTRLVEESNFDTAVWLALTTYIETPHSSQFLREYEEFLFRTFNGTWATTRVEWSKGWAFTDREGPWTNKRVFDQDIKNSLQTSHYRYYIEKVEEYDPYLIFTNPFTRSYFV